MRIARNYGTYPTLEFISYFYLHDSVFIAYLRIEQPSSASFIMWFGYFNENVNKSETLYFKSIQLLEISAF